MIEMYVSDRKVLYVFDNNIIQTRLIDGTFPDTNRLIPDAFDYELDLDAHYLLNAIDRVSLLTNEQNNIIKLDMSDEKVVLSSYMQDFIHFYKKCVKMLIFLILTTIYVIITLDFIKKEDSHEKNSNKR